MAFKMKGSAFKLGNVATKSALKQVTHTATIDGKKYKTKTYEDRENEEGLSQKEVLNNAYRKLEQAGIDIDELNKDTRFDDFNDLTNEEQNALIKDQKNVMDAYDLASKDYGAVSDSLNVVNKGFPMNSPLPQVHTHPGKEEEHNPMEEHDPPLHQHLVGGRGRRQPKRGLAKFIEKINPFDKQSRGKRRSNRGRRNIAKINTWRK